MSKTHTCYNISVKEALKEILTAFLGELPFHSFEENETGLIAYLTQGSDEVAVEKSLNKLQEQFDFTFEKEIIEYKNWNSIWESNFQPVLVDAYCGIRADFHPPFKNVKYEIVIQPKMAFGTGHHATTFMMMKMMENLQLKDAEVFDYGCGTGILAILASMEKAQFIDAVDIEEESYENTLENAQINHCNNLNVFHGILTSVPEKKYDVVLANINRNVILDSLAPLYKRLKKNGTLLVSGILHKDEELVKETAASCGFVYQDGIQRGDWSCLKLGL